MSKTTSLLRTATCILAGAILASGASSAFATDGAMELVARNGVADLLVDWLLTSS